MQAIKVWSDWPKNKCLGSNFGLDMLRAADEILRLKTALSSFAQISRVSRIFLFFLAGKPCVRGQATTATAAMLFSTCASTYQIQFGV